MGEKKAKISFSPWQRDIRTGVLVFSFCEDEKDLLKLISEHKKTNILLDFFKQCVVLPSTNSSKERYLKVYQAYGMTGIVTDWIEHGCVEDTETLARLCSEWFRRFKTSTGQITGRQRLLSWKTWLEGSGQGHLHACSMNPRLQNSCICFSLTFGFDRPGVIVDYYLMPLTSQIRNFMLNRRTQWVILLLRS